MSNPDGRIRGRESKPGCLSLSFDLPCANDSDRLHHLLSALEEWRNSNLGERIVDLTIIREQSLVSRLEVEHSRIASDGPLLSFDLVEPVVKKYGMEYMEALMYDAAGYYLSRQERSQSWRCSLVGKLRSSCTRQNRVDTFWIWSFSSQRSTRMRQNA